MTTWFTADQHFGHANVIKHCDRPFSTVDDMDDRLIEKWNAVVLPDDDIWHLGDFSFRGTKAPGDYLSRLTGRKHLVVGNHDSQECREHPAWTSSQAMTEISVDGVRIVLLHYAMRVWPRSHHGSLHLYGHSHGQLPGDRQSCDVGVDCWDYRPVSLPEIRERMSASPERALRMELAA